MSIPSGRGLGSSFAASRHAATQPVDLADDDAPPELEHEDAAAAAAAAAAHAQQSTADHESDSESEDESDSEGSSDNSSDSEGEGEEEDVGPVVCLFCPATLPSIDELLLHTHTQHQFDWHAWRREKRLDFYQQVKAINFIRSRIGAGESAAAVIALLQRPISDAAFAFLAPATDTAAAAASASSSSAAEADVAAKYLRPFKEDDALLFSLPVEEEEEAAAVSADASTAAATAADAPSSAPSALVSQLQATNAALVQQLQQLQEQHEQLQRAFRRVTVGEEDEEKGDTQREQIGEKSATATATVATSSSPSSSAALTSSSSSSPGSFAPAAIDKDYFGGYSVRRIHELMLRDVHRTVSYRDFIYNNKELFKGKTVLDVGCGTGILSLFAARAGARRVYAVDAADIADKAREIVAANGYSEVIKVVKGKMESVTLPFAAEEEKKVDIIISEWMGYFLLFESMLPSVLWARDRYLRRAPNAADPIDVATGVYPSHANMYIAAIETAANTAAAVDFWKDVYGFDMRTLIDATEVNRGASVEIVRPKQLLSTQATIKRIDCNTCVDAELDFESTFEVDVELKHHRPSAATDNAHSDSSSASSSKLPYPAAATDLLTAFAVWFDTPFSLHCTPQSTVILTTAPIDAPATTEDQEKTTHWMQSVFYIAKPFTVQKGDKIKGRIKAKR